ncbi:DUF6933 domain-containing protein [Paenisporosarcina sp.]|uniref:DUF6933 domain-containing protein n=1 Tax=Paenisporosarcina sp. TaxID=1932001 RepID=UPI003C788624
MLIIQCTKKLGDYLKKNLTDKPMETQDLFYSWHAHLFLIKRKKYIMVMNSQTRYVFVIGPVMAKDIKNLDEMIYSGIQENLEADGINSSFIEQYMQQLDGIEYMKTSERPIIGQMNDSIYYVECIQEYDGMLNIPKMNRSLNKVPMLKLPLVYSTRTFIQEMENRFS